MKRSRLRNYIAKQQVSHGFTIVELLIVIVVIGILAAITIVAYNGISSQAKESALKSELQAAAKQLQLEKIRTGVFPANTDNIKKADTTTLAYIHTDDTFCLAATRDDLPEVSYRVAEVGPIESGGCSEGGVVDGDLMQTITSANCPATRVRAVDARDNHTYWIQRLDDGRCWMLTNLAYAGGGTNAYNDTKVLSNGTGDSSTTYTVAKYYVVPSTTNYTTEPTAPSTATDGTGQYGYLYNWCAAMGAQNGTNGQPSTSACLNGTTPALDMNASICPAGWRVPTSGSGGEFAALNAAINGNSTSSSAGLHDVWLAQKSGYWTSGAGFETQGSTGFYWSSTHTSANFAYRLQYHNTFVNPSASTNQSYANAVRCIAL